MNEVTGPTLYLAMHAVRHRCPARQIYKSQDRAIDNARSIHSETEHRPVVSSLSRGSHKCA